MHVFWIVAIIITIKLLALCYMWALQKDFVNAQNTKAATNLQDYIEYMYVSIAFFIAIDIIAYINY